MKIYLASDHAGFELKEKLKTFLAGLGYEIKDFGAFQYDAEDDYPDFIIPAAKALSEDVKNGIESRAIILGGSGQGEAVVANRFKGVRATVYYGGAEEMIKLSREHNNANCLSLGARFLSEDEAKKAVKLWLETSFPNHDYKNWQRHQRRIDKIDKL
ncbi:MAG: ribose-5-phosphate isomerase [Candidatus Tagabacteria bacterium RIFCSPLOWO2_01_FULL_39_11]|uniref:Ribose-5-phosphate isomerase n=1 Tax=Candidatus Tagabacteria bacterium RIFCSPLOWO2_01_FULL_39_11 TaxID=1802295 RepID=A0A1G2LPS7_9BACT|nr:MAG: ribose-5-phosphate isomerase [Candidatus Tagabacteria bacterium RIFCSPLOWO2_01_FULL_39_11]